MKLLTFIMAIWPSHPPHSPSSGSTKILSHDSHVNVYRSEGCSVNFSPELEHRGRIKAEDPTESPQTVSCVGSSSCVLNNEVLKGQGDKRRNYIVFFC